MGLIKRLFIFVAGLLIATLCCHSMLTALLVIGWMSRRMRVQVLRHWWKKSVFFQEGKRFEEWMQQIPDDLNQNGKKKIVRRTFYALKENFRMGFQSILNIWILTLPAMAFWMASWHIGWNTSFNKVYEQAPVGVSLGVLGILFFIFSLFYVLPAQVRQSVTGDWRTYYQFRVLWPMIRQKGMTSFWIACCFSIASIPVTISQMAPTFFTQGFPELDAMTDAQLLEWISRYFFWVCLGSFVLYYLTHSLLARLYASAFLQLVRQESIPLEALTPFEQWVLKKLQLEPTPVSRNTPLILEVLKKNTRRATWIGTCVATFLVWFTLVIQIYACAFINYQPFRTWLNQPLIQVPCFRYIPPALEEAVKMQQATLNSDDKI